MDVGVWLGHLGLGQYTQAFTEKNIDAEKLRKLTSEDLKELGINALSHRRKILTEIFHLSSGKPRPLRLPADELPP